MRSIKHVVIAAAGMGTRMQRGIPKCLLEFGDALLIEHLLGHLKDVEDVRMVVGYKAEEVIKTVSSIRSDITFVINSDYRSTSTLASYFLGSEFLEEGVCYMDADIYFPPGELNKFFTQAETQPDQPLIGVTKARTEQCVFAKLDADNQITEFSRENVAPFEWANVAYLPKGYLSRQQHAVYQELEKHLPLPAFEVLTYEMDTPKDMSDALEILGFTA